MLFWIKKSIVLLLSFASLSFANPYFNNKILDDRNINFSLGVPLLIPPHSFQNSLGRHIILQGDYRKESKKNWRVPLIFRTRIEIDRESRLQSIAFYPGIRLPNTNRKTPIYFGVLLGAGFSNKSTKWPLYVQVFSTYRVYQFNKNISSLIEINAQYALRNYKWWRQPESISLLTTLDINF